MSSYYKCLCGDSEHLGMMEPDAVAVRDAEGRNWICYPITGEEVEKLTMLDHLADVQTADASARRHGFLTHGTEVRIYLCDNEHELAEMLSAEPPNEPSHPMSS